MNQQAQKYWLVLSAFPKFGPQKFALVRNIFGDPMTAWQAPDSAWRDSGLDQRLVNDFLSYRKTRQPDQEWEKLEREELRLTTLEDDDYPTLLKETYSPPPILYYRGQLSAANGYPLAVVGSRAITAYGRAVTQDLITDLARAGLTIVSGLALGVDALAHQTTLKNGGLTVGVLGSGLDWQNIYPTSNRHLARQILENNGALLSEFPIGTLPLKHHFPQRNRVISGLSHGVLVIEAGETSGSLITVKYALEQNREVFAVPGPIHNPMCYGTNNCIKQGAVPVTEAADILEALNLRQAVEFKQVEKTVADTPIEKILLELLNNEPLHMNDLIRRAKLPAQEVMSTMTMMELKGKIKPLGNMTYVLAR